MRSAVRLLLTASVGVVMLCAAPAQSNPVFLSAAYYNPAQLLPPPPADGSPEALAELRELQRIEKRRTPADFASAMIDEKTEDVTAFAAVMGPGFDLKSLPRTAELFDDVRNEEKFAAKLAKDFFKRNRPWIIDPKLHACATDDPPQSSYPSGHATLGYSMAVVLAALAPEKAQSIMARAAAYAENRLVCSMHYRRDIVAGQVLGTTVAAELMTTAGFRQEFDAAREELRAAHIVAQ
ncbi:MAG: phosphatase PAP2 family protein [Rhizomicrobium sp.]